MSKVKDYLYDVSVRHGYGGELTEEFLARLERGELRDTLLVIDRQTGRVDRYSQGADEFDEVVSLFADYDPEQATMDSMRLRAGEVLVTDDNVRLMVVG